MTQTPGSEQAQPGFFKKYKGLFLQALFLMALWLVLSGHFGLEHIIYGALSVLLVIWLNYKVIHVPMSNGEQIHGTNVIIHRMVLYLIWLLWQIIKSGTYVAYLTIHPKMPINPMVVRFKSRLPNPLAKVILGNSITLTPGTLTLDIKEDYFTVHALAEDVEEELVSGDMEARVGRLYLDKCTPEEMCTDISIMDSSLELRKKVSRQDGN